jgi:hypothetical protein
MHRRVMALVLVLAACSGDETSAATPTSDEGRGAASLGSATVEIPAASAFGDRGFHEVVEATGVLAESVPSGVTILVLLQDAGRPNRTCDTEHPLSGCVTVDWSDSPDRLNVPPGGVFDNHLAIY